jgi:hypothetical protein
MTKKLTYEQWQQLSEALENAVSKRELGEGGGHACLDPSAQSIGIPPYVKLLGRKSGTKGAG